MQSCKQPWCLRCYCTATSPALHGYTISDLLWGHVTTPFTSECVCAQELPASEAPRRRAGHKDRKEKLTENASDKSDTENNDEASNSILKPLSKF
ncbi:hypothetical protein INR49_003290 [Caranx melampygus]|nr:hypothetical protein INR49_003290 [Caranx melampygus]